MKNKINWSLFYLYKYSKNNQPHPINKLNKSKSVKNYNIFWSTKGKLTQQKTYFKNNENGLRGEIIRSVIETNKDKLRKLGIGK